MTKAQIKFIQSLSRQKYRKEYNAYLVEGDKNAKEWLQSDCVLQYIVCNSIWAQENRGLLAAHPEAECLVVEDFELEKITSLQTAQQVVLVVNMPEKAAYEQTEGEWSLFLEKIQDPGNMGTIIRTADWFGIRRIVCTPDCVERFNPKVVQASMGSLLRVRVYEMETTEFVSNNKQPLYAACLGGHDLRKLHSPTAGVIAMGNESQGLSPSLIAAATHQVTIPGSGTAESLNVSVAAGIICAQLTQA
ncbi:MAG: RNA methyltransferase [Sphingobacteriales bacterium]|nr:MAG: RNA methyltransferase [Sphingobacteriales bacterium]